jgi:ABC-type antimicrobial peptide transport system permease subunit
VADAAISHLTPGGSGGFTPPVAVATDLGSTSIEPNGDVYGNLISPGWFSTFSTGLVAGRDFSESDRPGRPRVAIVNRAFVRRFFGERSPIGRTLTLFPGTSRAVSMEIIGIADAAIYSSPRELPPPTWYVPMAQFDVQGFPFAVARLSLRADRGTPAGLSKSVAAAIASVNPNVDVTFRQLGDQLRASLVRERLIAQLAGAFGAVALLLTALGLYGLTAHAVAGRRPEIGIRVALGATPKAIMRLALTRIAMMIGVGLAAGVAMSMWAAPLVAGLLFDLSPREPTVPVAAAIVLLATAGLASWMPVRRAARASASTLLREP